MNKTQNESICQNAFLSHLSKMRMITFEQQLSFAPNCSLHSLVLLYRQLCQLIPGSLHTFSNLKKKKTQKVPIQQSRKLGLREYSKSCPSLLSTFKTTHVASFTTMPVQLMIPSSMFKELHALKQQFSQCFCDNCLRCAFPAP